MEGGWWRGRSHDEEAAVAYQTLFASPSSSPRNGLTEDFP